MKTYAKKVITNPLFTGSAVMILGSNMANFFAYLYHFVIGRLLNDAEYGEIGAILSVLGLLATALSFLGLVIVKFVSSAEENATASVYAWFLKIGTKLAIGSTIVLVLFSPILAGFLHISLPKILLIAPIFFFSIFNFMSRSFLQGLLRFGRVVITNNFEIVIRLIMGVVLVFAGLSVFGAVTGILLGAVLNFLLLKYFLKDVKASGNTVSFKKHKEVLSYAFPIFISSFFMYALISFDVILVKHYFSAEATGLYTVLSTLGKIVFFAASPVSAVMFPVISKRKALNQSYKSVFKLSLALTSVILSGILLGYLLLPELAITLLYGSGRYVEGYSLLFWFGLFIALYSLSSQVVSYFLSLEITNIVVIMPLAFVAQVIGIILFHDTIQSVITVSIVVTGALFLVLTGRLVYDKKI